MRAILLQAKTYCVSVQLINKEGTVDIFKDKPDNFYGYYEDSDGNQYTVVIRYISKEAPPPKLNQRPNITTELTEKVLEDGRNLLVHQDGFIISGTNTIIRPCKG
jgi:hypothetical protein